MNKNVIKLILYSIGVFVFGMLIAGGTYSYFSASNVEKTFTSNTGKIGLNITVNALSKEASTKPLIPQKTSSIGNAVKGEENGSCLDELGNAVCKVYEITVENTSSNPLEVSGRLEIVASTIPDLKWGKGTGATTGFSSTSVYALTETDLIDPKTAGLQTIVLAANGTQKYYIVVFLEETNFEQSTTNYGSFTGTVTFETTGGVGTVAKFS